MQIYKYVQLANSLVEFFLGLNEKAANNAAISQNRKK